VPDASFEITTNVRGEEKMKNSMLTAILAVLVLGFGAAVGCDLPNQIAVPEGNKATVEEMIFGQQAVTNYVSEMSTYLVCIGDTEKQEKRAIGAIPVEVEKDRKNELDKKHKDAAKQMGSVAEQFNEEAEMFRKRARKKG